MFGFTPCSIEREVLLLVYPSSVAQIVHSVTLEVVLLSVSSFLADIVGLFYGRQKSDVTSYLAQVVPTFCSFGISHIDTALNSVIKEAMLFRSIATFL